MGILQSKKAKPREKHPLNKDIKNENAGEAASDFNHSKANALTRNLDNAANSRRHFGPPQLQTETSSSSEATLMRMHPVPADNIPQNRERDTHKAACISQNIAAVKYFHSPHSMKQTARELDVQRSEVLQKLRDTLEKSRREHQQQQKTPAPVEAKARHFTRSQQQRPAAAETKQVPTPPSTAALCDTGTSADQVTVRVLYKDFSCQAGGGDLVQGVTKEHPQSKDVKTKANINILAGTKSGRALSQVNEESTDSTYHAAQTTTSKAAAAEVLAVEPTEATSQQKPKETEISTVQESSQQKGCSAVEGSTTKKHNKPHQTAQPKKADNNESSSSGIQKVQVEAEAAQVAGVKEMQTAAPNKPPAADTSVKLKLKTELKVSPPKYAPAKPKKKCTHKALNQTQHKKKTRDVTVKEQRDVKNRHVEKQEPDHSPAGSPEHKAGAKGQWHPFTVNQSCPRKVHHQDGPETALPPKTQNKPDESPNYPCEPLWVTTVRFAACLALREVEEGGTSQQ